MTGTRKRKNRSTTEASPRKSSTTRSLRWTPTSARKKKTSDAPIYLGLGSNLGNRFAHLRFALREIDKIAPVVRVSPFVETAPEGFAGQRPFLNAAVEVRSPMPAADLLRAAKRIERLAGRTPTFRNGPRTLDIDLLDVRGEIAASPRLTLPHARLDTRRFVLEPLAAIAPRWRHPVSGKTARQLLRELDDRVPDSLASNSARRH
ncbi:MAG TPA: 2-amino-4-hydroxy-6-hydroxymethyldihydropteridine diphosphokinase [Thermoanaerobaculia bacterium]|nr:2-amino-4-hydroxy-6-hydroxymethyldihydropteridine diphosphokinase [Thermoanaerobaculia bacterium]